MSLRVDSVRNVDDDDVVVAGGGGTNDDTNVEIDTLSASQTILLGLTFDGGCC